MSTLVQPRSLEDLLITAIAIARQCHASQVDKAGNPYIDHPLRVMQAGNTLTEKIVGVLHDAVEDSALTLMELTEAGFPEEIVAAIEAITKREDEPYEVYLSRVMTNPIALRVKIADMKDNMNLHRIAHPTAKDWARLRKYEAILPRLQQRLRKISRAGD